MLRLVGEVGDRQVLELGCAAGALTEQLVDRGAELVHEDWSWDGLPVTAGMYRRPLSAVFGALREAGFTIDTVDEPLPDPTAVDDARLLEVLSTKPVFLFVRALRP